MAVVESDQRAETTRTASLNDQLVEMIWVVDFGVFVGVVWFFRGGFSNFFCDVFLLKELDENRTHVRGDRTLGN